MRVFKEAGETTLVDVKFNNSNEKVLIKEVQLHPVTLEPIHVSFHKVDLTKKIRADIPVEVVGEEKCAIVQSGEGLTLTLLSEIEVEALPIDLPPHFEVDVSHLTEIDQGVNVGELKYDREKVEIVDLDPETLVVKIDYAEMEEEPEEEEVSEEELIEGMEVTEEKEVAEGEEEKAEETKETREKAEDLEKTPPKSPQTDPNKTKNRHEP